MMIFKHDWRSITVLLCAYGFMKTLCPAVPFLTPYLMSPVKNFTDVEVYSQIFPFSTYSYLLALIPIFFLTDLLRYKPIICVEALSLIATWSLMLWGRTVAHMQAMQISFGVASAAEIAYFSYIYGAVAQEHYKRVTSYVRGMVLIGKTAANGLGQLLISTALGDYQSLVVISLSAMVLTFAIALLLPSISLTTAEKRVSMVLESAEDTDVPHELNAVEKNVDNEKEKPILASESDGNSVGGKGTLKGYFLNISGNFRSAFGDSHILKWSIWWSLATCGLLQLYNYIQPLWATMQGPNGEQVYNGVTECLEVLFGALAAFSAQHLKLDWVRHGEVVLFAISALDALLVMLIAWTSNLFLSYGLYIAVCASYQLLVTIISHNIANRLESASYGLVFGWNTFMALIVQTLLTVAVVDKSGFALDIRAQFFVYALYYGVVAIVFLGMILLKVVSSHGKETAPKNAAKTDEKTRLKPS